MTATVGQDVWLYKGDPTSDKDAEQYPARITVVHSETLVDVVVAQGTPSEWAKTSVQKGNVPPATFYWEEKTADDAASE